MFTAARSVRTSAGSSSRCRRGNERQPSDKCRQISGRLELFEGALYTKARASNGSTVGRGMRARCASKVDATLRTRNLVSYAYLQNVALKADHTVIQQSSKPVMVNHGSFRISAVAVRYPTKIDGEVAHDPLDDVGAKPVVLGERIALCRGQPTFRDALQIIARRDDVLNEALRQTSYRAGAEADEDVAAIVGVSLKIPSEPPSGAAQAPCRRSAGRSDPIRCGHSRQIRALRRSPRTAYDAPGCREGPPRRSCADAS